MSRKLTLPQLKKYDISQKVIEALADSESRAILFSIVKKGNTAAELSDKLKIPLSSVYKKLSGEEIPTSLNNNPIFAKNVKYSDKAYRKMILEMNHLRRQQQRLSPE